MINKRVLIKSFVLLCVLTIGFLSIADTGCQKKKKQTGIVGSSNPNAFIINAPSGLTAINISTFQTDLSWNDTSNNEDGFAVERKTWSGGVWQEIATVAIDITSFSDFSVFVPATTYYYRVRAFNDIGDYSAYSNEAGMTTLETGWQTVAAGGLQTYAITTNRMLWTWGNNSNGQLGLGDDGTDRLIPTLLNSSTDWSIATGGLYHGMALKLNGTLWGWGANSSGQMGMGDTDFENWEPFQIDEATDWSFIDAGDAHTMAIKTNRTLWGWGANLLGQIGLGDSVRRLTPSQTGTDSDWETASACYGHTLALKTNRSLWSWGWNFDGELGFGDTIDRWSPNQISSQSDWSNLIRGVSPYFSAAIKTTGTLWVWGRNDDGQLGLGDHTTDRKTVTQLGTSSDWAEVSGASSHTIGLKTDGTAWSWGFNSSYGNLGIGTTVPLWRETPTQIGTDSDWVTNSSGNSHNMMIKTDRTLWACGFNGDGQLGLRDIFNRPSPTKVTLELSPLPPSGLWAIDASSARIDIAWQDNAETENGFKIERKLGRTGTYQQIALVDSNVTLYSDTAITDGVSYYYRVRAYNNYDNSEYSNETAMAVSGNWSLKSTGCGNIIAQKTDGFIWAWGYNSSGTLGLGDLIQRNTPTQVGIYSDWSDISSGSAFTITIKNDPDGGTIWGWGTNGSGQLGMNDTTTRNTPTQIDSLSDWSMVTCGTDHTISIKTNRTLWGWGQNYYAQLGVGTSGIGSNKLLPTQISTETVWAAVGSGNIHSLALTTNNTLWTWGNNQYGQLGIGNTDSKNTPTQAGTDSDWSLITRSCKNDHTVTLKINGTIWAWGYNNGGQLGLGDSGTGTNRNTPTQIGNATDWSIITCGAAHSIACKTDGTIWLWGANTKGQLGFGDTFFRYTPSQLGDNSSWASIGAGQLHSVASRTNGTIWAWGQNSNGQLGQGDTIDRKTPTFIGE